MGLLPSSVKFNLHSHPLAVVLSGQSEGNGLEANATTCNHWEAQHHFKVLAVFTTDFYFLSLYCSCVKVAESAHEMVYEW